MPEKPSVRTTMTRVLVIQAITLLALWLLQTRYGS
jgi:hypothetical protein